MLNTAKVFIFITAIFHFLFFKLESIDFMMPDILDRFGLTPSNAKLVEPWAFNQGFYNLFLALGLLLSLYLLRRGKKEAGFWLASFILFYFQSLALESSYSYPHKTK